MGRDQLCKGERVAKTMGKETRAVILDMTPASRLGRIAYFFDLSGEVMATSMNVRTQPYLARTQALAVVVDPLAMSAVRSSLTEEEVLKVIELDPSMIEDNKTNDPGFIIHRLVQVRGDGSAKLARLAVVVTKKDILSNTGIGSALAQETEPVESWLRRFGLRNELDLLSQHAREVRYLASGFEDDGEELLALIHWSIGLDGQRLKAWRWPSRGHTAPPTRDPWPSRDLKGRIPPSYRVGRRGLLGSFILAAVAGPVLLVIGLVYLSLFL